MAGTITDPKVAGVRRALLDALAGQGITVTTAAARARRPAIRAVSGAHD